MYQATVPLASCGFLRYAAMAVDIQWEHVQLWNSNLHPLVRRSKTDLYGHAMTADLLETQQHSLSKPTVMLANEKTTMPKVRVPTATKLHAIFQACPNTVDLAIGWGGVHH